MSEDARDVELAELRAEVARLRSANANNIAGWQGDRAGLSAKIERLEADIARLTRERDEAKKRAERYADDMVHAIGQREKAWTRAADEAKDADEARKESELLRAAVAELRSTEREKESDRLLAVIKNAHGALADAGDVSVPGGYDELLGPAIEELVRQRNEARRDLRALADAARRYWKAEEASAVMKATSSFGLDASPGARRRVATELVSSLDALCSILSRLDGKDGGK